MFLWTGKPVLAPIDSHRLDNQPNISCVAIAWVTSLSVFLGSGKPVQLLMYYYGLGNQFLLPLIHIDWITSLTSHVLLWTVKAVLLGVSMDWKTSPCSHAFTLID